MGTGVERHVPFGDRCYQALEIIKVQLIRSFLLLCFFN